MSTVMASPRGRDVADRVDDPFLGQGIERRRRLVEDEQVRPPQQGASDGQPLLLAARYFHAAFADQRVEAAVGAGQQAVARRLAQHVQALGVGRRRVDEQQVFANGAGKQLGVLGDESDSRSKSVEVDVAAGNAVVQDAARARLIEARPAA